MIEHGWFEASFDTEQEFIAQFEDNSEFAAEMESAPYFKGAPYTGNYVVDPAFEAKVLPTTGKTLDNDIRVNAIFVGRTDNAAGGKTVYIGGIFDA